MTNNFPTGSVFISGTPSQGSTLIASNNLEDLDGIPVEGITYQWHANGIAIAGASGSTYLLGQADVGTTISVVASYTDTLGTAEAVASEPTAAIANSNDSPTGSVTISGSPIRGQVLTAANTIADADGIAANAISYQWFSNTVAINGATGSTYVPTYADGGNTISVVATYHDNYGTWEQVVSLPTERVRIADVVSNALAAYRVPGIGLDGDEDIDITDQDLEIARVLDLANGYTTGILDVSAATSVFGIAADLITAYSQGNTATIQGLGDEIISVRDTTLDATILNRLDPLSTNTVNAASIVNLTGLAADLMRAYGAAAAGTISGLGNEAVFLADSTIDATDLNALNAYTTGVVNAGSVVNIRGSAAELAPAFLTGLSGQIIGLGAENAVLTDVTLDATTLNRLNGYTLGFVNAASLRSLTGLAVDLNRSYTAGIAGEIRGLGNESVTLTDSSLAATGVTALVSIDSRTTGMIDASGLTSLSSTLVQLHALFNATGISGLLNQTLTLTNSTATALAVNASNANTLQRATNRQAYRISYTGSTGNDSFSGFDLADTLSGGDGDDALAGALGADVLIGGNGADSLSGGDGADIFRYTALNQSLLTNPANSLLFSHDLLTDFEIGIDSIDGPVAVTAANVRHLGAVSSLDAAGIAAVLTSATFLANRAASFTLGSDAAARTFVALNNGQNGYQATLDSIIEITGYSGLLTDLAIL